MRFDCMIVCLKGAPRSQVWHAAFHLFCLHSVNFVLLCSPAFSSNSTCQYFCSPFTPFHDLQILSVRVYFPCLHPSTKLSFQSFLTLPCNHSPRFLPHLTLCVSLSISPPPVSLIVLFCTEGYSCLQGYENVRKAHSISSYVNSHFPPEQTHFPGSDLPRSMFRIPLPTSFSNT